MNLSLKGINLTLYQRRLLNEDILKASAPLISKMKSLIEKQLEEEKPDYKRRPGTGKEGATANY